MKRKYKLEIAGCTDKAKAVQTIYDYAESAVSLEVANTIFEKEEMEEDYENANFRTLVEELDTVGVQMYDLEKIQFPNVGEITREQPCYT